MPVKKSVKGLGGKVQTFHFAFGEDDVYVIVDLPDNVAAAALGLAVSATGLVGVRTVVLLTPTEVDEAAKRQVRVLATGQVGVTGCRRLCRSRPVRHAREAEVVETPHVFHAAQQRVVVVRLRVRGAGLGVIRDEPSTATRPPPGPSRPGTSLFGDGGVLQHTVESPWSPLNSASSNVITSIPSAWNAGESRICGTHVFKNWSAEVNPPGWPSTHGSSCPSWQRFGVMYDKFGVAASFARSESARRGRRRSAQLGSSITEWKYTNGL